MMYINSRNEQGFSLVETLVAITILLIVIVGPITLVANSARSTAFANDQVIAFFLAQEGVEFIHAAFNDLQLQSFANGYAGPTAWARFTNKSTVNGLYEECYLGGCGIHLGTVWYGDVMLKDCRTTDEACRLYYDDTEGVRGRYTHESSHQETKFTRVITIDDSVTTGQAEIRSTVTWRSDGQRTDQQIEAVTYIFDIYGR